MVDRSCQCQLQPRSPCRPRLRGLATLFQGHVLVVVVELSFVGWCTSDVIQLHHVHHIGRQRRGFALCMSHRKLIKVHLVQVVDPCKVLPFLSSVNGKVFMTLNIFLTAVSCWIFRLLHVELFGRSFDWSYFFCHDQQLETTLADHMGVLHSVTPQGPCLLDSAMRSLSCMEALPRSHELAHWHKV